MRKSGLPILKVRFPDGSEQPYWNTFYQEITYNPISVADLKSIKGLTDLQKSQIVQKINDAIEQSIDFSTIDFEDCY